MPTPQQQAVASAQNLAALAAQVIHLGNAIDSWLKDYNQNIWDTYWNAMPTAAISTDGTIAGSNDVSPNAAHPINVPVATPLLMSRNQLITAKTAVSTLQTLFAQAGGTLTVPNQAIVQTCALIAPNTIG